MSIDTASYQLKPRPLSSLTYRILGINIAALAVLVLGILYLGQYRQALITSELELLKTEIQFYSAVASESVGDTGPFDKIKAQRYATALSEVGNRQVVLLSGDGDFLAVAGLSAATLMNPVDETTQNGEQGFRSLLDQSFNRLVKLVAVEFDLPHYPGFTQEDKNMKNVPDVSAAMTGGLGVSVWRAKDGGLLMSAAAPIYSKAKIVAIVLVTKTDTAIEKTFSKLRFDVFRIFIAALTITFALSLYLSGIIGHPLRQLAQAAEIVRKKMGRDYQIPDFSNRKDEIGELSIALRDMTKSLHDRMDSIERFAADVAHELKNPLTSLHSAVETLQRVKKDEDRIRLQNIILHDVRRMDRLISDISAASRLDAELSREGGGNSTMQDILLPLIDSFRKPINRGTSVSEPSQIILRMSDAPVFVRGNTNRLGQVFQNLISNALSFSKTEQPVIITVTQSSGEVVVTVDDEGPGIPEGKLAAIFDRFYTERPHAESFGSHSGLGLSIAQQIVETYDGSIHAENRRNTDGSVLGARFVVRLKEGKA